MMRNKLLSLDLNLNNSIVIGSGILQALGIRESKDIDLVVTKEDYSRLKASGKFTVKLSITNREILTDEFFEIGPSWYVLDKNYEFSDFISNSIVIEGVRYITLDFLQEVKRSWVKNGTARPKDIEDLKLIDDYRKNI